MKKIKHILILGGTNFLGPLLIKSLSISTNKITIFNRGITVPPFDMPESLNIVLGDRNKPSDIEKLFSNNEIYDTLFDFSGHVKEHVFPLFQFRKQIRHYIFCSTSAVYEYRNSALPITEISPLIEKREGVGGKIDSYSDGKIEIENALFKGLNDKGTPVTVIRENLIFGLKSPWYFGYIFYRLSNRLPIYIFEDSQIVNTNPVFVEDVIQAFLECMSNKISHGKIYNMGGIELVSELDMIRLCEKISSIKATVYKLPTLSNALPEQRGVGFHEWGYYNLSTAAITQELNYKLTPLEVSVKEIYKELMFSPSLMKEYYFRGETIILKNYPLTFQAHLVILILKILRWIMGFWR